MKFRTQLRNTLLIMMLGLISQNLWATTYHYRADVEGMVCAFCVYSVSKNIRKLPGVDADSVDVSLKNKSAIFSSSQKVSMKSLSKLFSQSGFKISHLVVTKRAVKKSKQETQARLDLKIDVFETDQFTWVLQAIGDTAAKMPSRFIVEAPAEQEEIILKALLMGRKQVVQVRFIENDEVDNVHLQLFSVLN